MAEFDFPSTSLTNGQTYTANGVTFVWDSTNGAWKKNPASATKGQKGEPSTVAGPPGADGNDGNDGTPGTPGSSIKGEPGADNSTKGQKGEAGADNSTKGQKGEPSTVAGPPGADNSTKGQKGEQGTSGSATINNNADNRVITGSSTSGELNGEQNFTYDGNNATLTHTSGQIDLNASDGSIEITRTSSGAFIDFKNDVNEDSDARITENGGGFIMTGVIQNASVASAWVQFNGTGTVSIQSDINVSTITDYGVGDYQVNYSNQLKDGNNSTTDYQAISLAITGTVYNVPGQLAHTHPFVYTADKNHVRFLCYKTEQSTHRADQPYAGVIVFS